MTTLVYTHRSSLRYETPPGHPERVDRIKAVYSVLDAPHFAAAQRREAPRATEAQLLLAHTPEHVQRIFAVAPEERLPAAMKLVGVDFANLSDVAGHA